MNIKIFTFFLFAVCLFQSFAKASNKPESTLKAVQYMRIENSAKMKIASLISLTPDNFLGKDVHINSDQQLIALHAFGFSNGQVRFVGVLPQGSRIIKLPCSEDDTFGYGSASGAVVYISLSKEPISLVHPKF